MSCVVNCDDLLCIYWFHNNCHNFYDVTGNNIVDSYSTKRDNVKRVGGEGGGNPLHRKCK